MLFFRNFIRFSENLNTAQTIQIIDNKIYTEINISRKVKCILGIISLKSGVKLCFVTKIPYFCDKTEGEYEYEINSSASIRCDSGV